MKRTMLSFIDIILLFTVVVIALLARAPRHAASGRGKVESHHRYVDIALQCEAGTFLRLDPPGQDGVTLFVDPRSPADARTWRLGVLGADLPSSSPGAGAVKPGFTRTVTLRQAGTAGHARGVRSASATNESAHTLACPVTDTGFACDDWLNVTITPDPP